MFKVKLLILLLTSLAIISCANNKHLNHTKLSVSYLGGEYDGLVLSNQLKKHLNNFGMLDKNSNYQVGGVITHSSNLYITNIDKTSDRERVHSSVVLHIYDSVKDCKVHSYLDDVSQFCYEIIANLKLASGRSKIDPISLIAMAPKKSGLDGFLSSSSSSCNRCKGNEFEKYQDRSKWRDGNEINYFFVELVGLKIGASSESRA